MSMFDGILYHNPIEYDDMVYSVDDVKINFTIGQELACKLFSNWEYLCDIFQNPWLKSDKEVAHRKLEFEISYI